MVGPAHFHEQGGVVCGIPEKEDRALVGVDLHDAVSGRMPGEQSQVDTVDDRGAVERREIE
ncbi:hypothetical protein MARA_01430 (plasmid) [Mycolicibacterium arabiense]|uniref:Uncharacterized protein n=1 Tax=Mycolicibacterium arabiense TaxID=1286181 RepID=A0A7I7RQ98_9MYCO|nr:hypothetical protein MARA_01430 [Mycolicibacterium arabiense]